MQNNFLPRDNPLPLGEPAHPADENFGLGNIMRTLMIRRRIILGAAITVVVLATLIVLQMTPLYSATAVVMLDQRKNNVADATAVLAGLTTDPATVQNQIQILTSLELAGRVVDKLKLDQDPEFNAQAGGVRALLRYLNPLEWLPGHKSAQASLQAMSLERSALLRAFQAQLSVQPLGLSTAIEVTFQSQDPEKAARIANAVADAYVEDQLEAKFEATQKATTWLSSRIQELSRKAQETDAAVQRFKAEHNINTAPNGVSVVQQQTTDVNSQLIIAKADLAEKQANYSSLVALQRAGKAANAPQVVASSLISALRAQETDLNRQLADVSSRYLPSHPKVLDLKAQKENLEGKIDEEVQRIVESVRSSVTTAEAHVGSLQASLGRLENQNAGQNESSVQLTALQSAATSARSMYEAFLGRLNQTQGQEGIETPDARVISTASIPTFASYPRRGLVIGLSIPAGLMFGLMLAFAAEHLDSGFRTSAQIESLLSVPVLAVIPEIATKADPPGVAADLVINEPMSAFAEALRGLRLGLSLTNVDYPHKTILVTSSVPGEGKTTVTLSLARLAAKSGLKVLVIDGDLRRPAIAGASGVVGTTGGIVEALSGAAGLEQCLHKDSISDAVILPCLKSPPNPPDMLSSQAMQHLVANLQKAFDLVLIDSAPVLPVNDTRMMIRYADAVLFVTRWEETPREAVLNAVRSLRDIQAPVAGVVLTRADSERFHYYNYGYQDYHEYNKYYRG